LGADIKIEHGYVDATAKRLRGASIAFPIETVTGTENLMMAAVLAEGTTRLSNCAREPEIVDLADLLTAMGAEIQGAGTGEIVIEGGRPLHGAAHRVIPDRIEAGTYLIAGALVGDDVEVMGARHDHLDALLAQLAACGVEVSATPEGLRVAAPKALVAHDLRTSPHPGFPTDMQAQYMTLMTQAKGVARIAETVFERRFMHVGELHRMGADIRIEGRSAVVTGPTRLTGAQVMATDLRASACLVLAGLVADGPTLVDRVYHLDRGYESMETKLGALGASIERIRA
jgi:UDP-N-acetylglucosamine 1-carboxyvinyltransferase